MNVEGPWGGHNIVLLLIYLVHNIVALYFYTDSNHIILQSRHIGGVKILFINTIHVNNIEMINKKEIFMHADFYPSGLKQGANF